MKSTRAVAIVGGKRVGKTTTGEKLTSELARRGHKIAAIKHIPEPDFTMDSTGKDTWRYNQAGAEIIIAVSPKEIVTIEKSDAENMRIGSLLKKCIDSDLVFIEGMKNQVARNQMIPKIAVVTTREQAENSVILYQPILAFSGPYNTEHLNLNIPYADAMRNPEKLADIVEENLLKK